MTEGAISLPGVDWGVDGAAHFQPESLLGTVVAGRYRLSGHLASGGMAAVYVAEDTEARRDVALKLLRPDLEESPEVVRQFLCEGSIASLIDHENVVRVLDHGGGDGTPHYIAMELLEGEGLFDRLRRRGALAPSEAAAILVQVCAGLESAHRQGIVHRDLKPENVFLHGRGGVPPVVKLLDFGVARAANVEADDKGLVVGTPEYLSPEQAFGQEVDARSDVYSVGVMAWRMLAGRAPFSADSAGSLIRKQAREPVPPLTEARPDLASLPELVDLLARACAKDPADRPATAAAFAEELVRAIGREAPELTPAPVPIFGASPARPGPAPAARAGLPAGLPGSEATSDDEPRGSSPGTIRTAARGRGDGSRKLRLASIAVVVIGLALAGGALLLHTRPVARAERLAALGRQQEARDVLLAALKSRPGDAGVRAQLARALLRTGQASEAMTAFEEAVRLDPAVLQRADLDALAGALSRGGAAAERAALLLEGAHRLDPVHTPDAVATWGPLLEDADCDVRRTAAARLGASADPAAIPRLERLAGRREGRAPSGVSPGHATPSVCGAAEAAEAIERLRPAAPAGQP
jgi:serine/threonine-protein kinase